MTFIVLSIHLYSLNIYKQQVTSYLQYLQVIQPLQRDSMPWQSEVIKKEAMAKFNI